MQMSGRLSLVQQLAQLAQPAPVDFDPENLTPPDSGSDGEGQAVSLAAREHYFEVGPSSLRKLNDSLIDPKYAGVKTSRKEALELSKDEWQDYDEEEEEEVNEEREEGRDERDNRDELDSQSNATNSASEEDEELDVDAKGDSEQDSRRSEPRTLKRQAQIETQTNGDLTNVLQRTREADLRKGKAVTRQINVWDSLLDARIRLQKTATTVNKITSSASRNLSESEGCQGDLQKYLEESILLTEDLFELQEAILNVNEVADPPPRKKRRIREDDNLETCAAYLTEATTSSANLEQAVHPWLVQTLTKWSAKIQAVAPSVLLPSNRNTFSKKAQNVKFAVQMVDEALLDHPNLLARTRIARGKAKNESVGEKEEDSEIFDDTDFYQQMLRDVIESRGDGEGAMDDWVALQRERKAKKKVDTKASKGRKLRYEVHEKLQNFMVPVPAVGAWHEEQIDELFASVLGKGFENAIEDGTTAMSSETVEIEGAVRGGFRVFG